MQVQASKSIVIAITLAAGSIAPAFSHGAHAQSAADTLRATHVLNRLTFGARPGDLENVLATGVDRWIAAQLRPELIVEAPLPDAPNTASGIFLRQNVVPAPQKVTMAVKGDTVVMTSRMQTEIAALAMARKVVLLRVGRGALDGAAVNHIRRAASTDRQLAQVMTDFWINHFSVYRAKSPSPTSITEMVNSAIVPNALGKFRDLLGAVAESPAMLHYLDNRLSAADTSRMNVPEYQRFLATGRRPASRQRAGLNENYARELLELHTMGVDAGYSQNDVIEVARAFTGWTLSTPPSASVRERVAAAATATFTFDEDMHDAEAKTVLGNSLAAGRGKEDGLQVLDIIARHPSTARYIARKLVTRFVSDDPPEELVRRAAETFTRTDGDMREVLRTIVTSDEFFAPEAFRSKVRSPQELILAMHRAVADGPGDGVSAGQLMNELNQVPFGKETPDGWPETGSAWMSSGAMFNRVGIAMRVATGAVPAISPDSSVTWRALANSSFENQLQSVVNIVLGGKVSDETRSALAASRSSRKEDGNPADGKQILHELLTIALGSPEFQRR